MAEIQRGEVTIHYEIEGDGPALLLHTGGGGDLRMWRIAGYTRGLRDWRLVLMDHRGHGVSSRPRAIEHHGIDAFVEDVVAVADHLGVERFSYFGYSAGAALGYRLVTRHPERLTALIGLGGVGMPSETTKARLELATRVRDAGSEALVASLREAEPELPEWFASQMRATDPEMFALAVEGWAPWGGPWAEFARVTAPTPIITGEFEEGPDGRAAGSVTAWASYAPISYCHM